MSPRFGRNPGIRSFRNICCKIFCATKRLKYYICCKETVHPSRLFRTSNKNISKLLQIVKVLFVLCFFLGNSPVSKLCMPRFRNILFHLHRQVGVGLQLPAYEDRRECSETSAYKIQTPWNYPEESIQRDSLVS